mmetsp:Transcript_67781/g.177738  ORF Transcript_67781/g.177738 Transcript_67781/m.177738 type:complete len:247 (+) Transcript_67781:710-1450(+)
MARPGPPWTWRRVVALQLWRGPLYHRPPRCRCSRRRKGTSTGSSGSSSRTSGTASPGSPDRSSPCARSSCILAPPPLPRPRRRPLGARCPPRSRARNPLEGRWSRRSRCLHPGRTLASSWTSRGSRRQCSRSPPTCAASTWSCPRTASAPQGRGAVARRRRSGPSRFKLGRVDTSSRSRSRRQSQVGSEAWASASQLHRPTRSAGCPTRPGGCQTPSWWATGAASSSTASSAGQVGVLTRLSSARL